VHSIGRSSVAYVAAGVGKLVRSTSGQWMVRPPTHCPSGHRILPGRTLVGHQACAFPGGDTTWTCTCGATFHKGKLLERPVDITPEISDAEPSNAGSEVA